MDGDHSKPRGQSGQGAAQGAFARAAVAARSLPVPPEPSHLPPVDEAEALAHLFQMRGHLTHDQLANARRAMRGQSLSYGHILLTRGWITEAELLSALSQIHNIGVADLNDCAPEPGLAALLPVRDAIAAEAVVWRRAGRALVIATSRPDRMDELRAQLPEGACLVFALASRAQILAAQRQLYGTALAREAEGRAPRRHSCRGWRGASIARLAMAFGIVALTLFILSPALLTGSIVGLAVIVFFLNTSLKFAACGASVRADRAPQPPERATLLHLPTISILVPLFREPEVAGALLERLQQIDYPRERLDVILAVEEDDPLTLGAIREGSLPPWMRAVTVPRGHPQTKPRALNYVLNYARGEIVGIYDAEDRPEPNQLRKVAQHFAEASPKVACLQGRLDYYNSGHNALAAMFTVEYASWFRVQLPGVQKLGLVVPLGGTTLFLRRSVLERVGAWDAHNVTEDAELGLRLARAGYETQIIDTTTFEEANAAALPWIRQRSRWLKGYLMTWGAAMRRPNVLRRELGLWRYLGVQVQFLGGFWGFFWRPFYGVSRSRCSGSGTRSTQC